MSDEIRRIWEESDDHAAHAHALRQIAEMAAKNGVFPSTGLYNSVPAHLDHQADAARYFSTIAPTAPAPGRFTIDQLPHDVQDDVRTLLANLGPGNSAIEPQAIYDLWCEYSADQHASWLIVSTPQIEMFAGWLVNQLLDARAAE